MSTRTPIAVAAAVVLAVAAVSTSGPGWGFPGDPVSTYGAAGGLTVTNSGVGALDIAVGTGYFFDVAGPAAARQPDGSLVVATQTAAQAVVVRYTPDGALDTAFGDGGTAVVDFGGQDRARAVAVDADGRIVVAGSSLHPVPGAFADTKMAVLRLLPDGSVDPSFNGGAAVLHGWPGANMVPAAAVALQPDGRIVVGGYENVSPTSMLFERLMPDGSLDSSFSGDGLATLPAGAIAGVTSLAVSGGTIVAAGGSLPAGGGGSDVVVAELSSSGTPVTGFGSGGVVTTDLGGQDQANALAIDAGGRIVVAADADAYGQPHGVVLRYSATGALDAGFSGDGRISPSGLASARGIDVDAQGSVVVTGSGADQYNNPLPAAARMAADGTPDASFGPVGVRSLDRDDARGDRGSAVFATGQGSVTIVGLAERYRDTNVPVLIRWRSDGVPDPTYGTDGVSLPQPPAPALDAALASAVTEDGGLVVVGSTARIGTGVDVLVARYTPAGVLDPAFGDDGLSILDLGGDDDGRAVAVQDDGRIVVAGTADGHAAVVRLTATGDLDPTFSGDGRWVHDPDNTFDGDAVTGVAVAPNGDIVASGTGTTPGTFGQGQDIEAIRLLPDGTPDPAFSGDGVVTTDAGGLHGSDYHNDGGDALALLADGTPLVAGYSYRTGSPDPDLEMTVVHYLADGSLDPDFGQQGIATPDLLPGGGASFADSIAVDGAGRIVLTGYTAGSPHLMAARLTPAGAIDTTFGTNGHWIGWIEAASTALDLAPGGRIVIASGTSQLVRLQADGTLDPTFGDDGVATVADDAALTDVHAVSGLVLVTGTTYGDLLVGALDDATPGKHTLTVSVAGTPGGHVRGPGIDCPGDCSQAYADGRTVTLTASAASSSPVFGSWSGDCSGSDCSVTMSTDRSVSASFHEPQVQLSVTVVGHGSVTGSGISCLDTCELTYDMGAFLTLDATPDPGYRFAGWSGDCSGQGDCAADLSADRSVTATFTPLPPPDTAIAGVKVDSVHHRATVTMTATGKGKPFTFECALDGAAFAPCTSPTTYKKLKAGKHTVTVRAVNVVGAADATPATKSFKVAR